MSTRLAKRLDAAVVEKDVENAYRTEIQQSRPEAVFTSPHKTDGFATWAAGATTVRLLLEAKYDLDFKSKLPVCNTLAQCLFYIKHFEASGEPLPNVILVGDKNECFVLDTKSVQGFLDKQIKWGNAPSTGDPDLTKALVDEVDVLPYVYDVDETLQFETLLHDIETLADGKQPAVRANPGNLQGIYFDWRDRVFADSSLSPVEQVDVFLRCLFQGGVHLDPARDGILMVPDYGEVRVNSGHYKSFFAHFLQGYKTAEIEAFYASKDRLVEDDARRRQGAFFTPDVWVAEAHKSLDKVLGPNWKEECIVWDPAAGTANLTRDYRFDDLIISTAEKPDVLAIKGRHYNKGAGIFQYDFLNPGVESPFFEKDEWNLLPRSVDARLKAAAKAGKRLVFLMNPPYGTAANAGTGGDHKAGIAKTAVNGEMKKAKLGSPSQQLYAQFMYQCSKVAEQYGFGEHTVALFSVPTFMSSGSYRKFRQWWYGRYGAKDAFMFRASHFADVSGRWGISFTVWNSPDKTGSAVVMSCTLKDENHFAVTDMATKALYNSDDREASKWVRESAKGLKGTDAPQMSSGLNVRKKGAGVGSPKHLAFLANCSNNIQKSDTDVYWLSAVSSRGRRDGGFSVTDNNWRRALALFGARLLVKESWEIWTNEYLAPCTEGTPTYEQWVNDCHVYAILYSRRNNCTAMRDVPYKGKTWQISNHFFWLTHREALEALDTPKTPTLCKDCKTHPSKDVFGAATATTPDPYMAHVLSDLDLSPEAKAVLDQLKALWLKSLPERESYAAGKPELHLTAWDAGVYQLKHLWRDLFPTEWADLQVAFRALAAKLRPGVYEHGFLLGEDKENPDG